MSLKRKWHCEVIPKAAETLLPVLFNKDLGPFYLAGGTALALQFGHRLSRDLDFFRKDAFDEESIIDRLRNMNVSVIAKAKETLHLHIAGIKVSFLGYHYPVLFPFQTFMGASVADPRDIACMKMSAIAGRGARRDFIDLFVIAQEYGLARLLDHFKEKYAQIDFNLVHALKSLTYFADAENEPMPEMLTPLSWNQVAEFFRQEAPKLI